MSESVQANYQLILNVDDVDSMRYARSRALTAAGYRVIEASTGEEALLMAAALLPQLVVLDVKLPGIGGLEVCKRIKSDPSSAHIMVLQVSSSGDATLEVAAGLDGGADGYLIEPTEPLELVATVRALLRLSEQQAENRRLADRLNQVERQFAEATDAADCGVWDWDIRSGRLDWFGKTERLAGLRPGGFSGKIEGFSDVLHDDDRRRVWQKLQDLMARRETSFEDEHRFVHPDGSVHWMSGIGRFFYDEQGQAVRMTGVVQDITKRKLIEERQQLESERRRLLACAAEQLLVGDNPASLMTGVFETVRQHLDLDGYFHYRVDESGGALVLEACAGVPDQLRTGIEHVDFGQGLCGTAAQRRTPEIWERVHDLHDEKAQGVKALGCHAFACHPLIVGERLLGTLAFASTVRDRFEPDEIAFMQSICRYVAAAMERLRLEAVTKERAERLRRSEEHLRIAMELNPQIPWTARPDGSLEGINERWLQLSGFEHEEALDDSWMKIQHEEDLPRMIAAWTHSIRTGEAYDIEHRLRPALGEYRWMRSRAFPRRDDQGRILRWYGTTEDIHDRKLAEEALRESRERLQSALQFSAAVMANIKEGLYTVNVDGLVTYVNPAAETLFGWSSAELLGRKMHAITHYQHRDGTPFPAEECAGLQVLREGKTLVEHPDVFIRKDGTFFDVVYSSAPMWSDDSITGLVVVFRDVSEKRKFERALIESAERFRTMAEAVPSFLFETDGEGWNTWTSEGWCRFTGQTQEQVRGHGWADALHPDDRAANIGRWTECMRDGVPFESRQRLRRADGYYAWVMAKALPVRDESGMITRWLGCITDVDELIRGEEALRQSEERFRQIAETTDYVFWMIELNPERVLYVSPAFETVWQRPASALYQDARVWSDAILADDRGQVLDAYERWVSHPDREVFDVQYRIVRPDGTIRWIADQGHVICDAAGRTYRLTGIARDVTAMKESEAALRQSEERLRLAQSAATIGTFDWDIATGRVLWSPELEQIWGLPVGGFQRVLDDWRQNVHPDDRPQAEALVQRALTEPAADYDLEHRIIRPDGTVRWIHAKATSLRDTSGSAVRMVGINMDITERKLAEQSLRKKRERLTLALQAGQMGVYDLNLVDHQLWWSPEIYALFGVAPEQFVPTLDSFNALVHPQDRDGLWWRFDEAIGTRRLYVHEFRIVRPDGVIRWIAEQGQTVYDDKGRPVRHFGIASDITERKEGEEALRRQGEQLRVITDSVASFIAYVDSGERYRFVNAEYEKWFHRPRHAIVGLSVRELLRDGYAEVEPFVRRVLAGEAVRFERDSHYGGAQHTMLASYTPDVREDGTVAGFYVLVTDISERKRHEDELRRWKDELEVRVQERTQELVASQERLRALASQLSVTEQRERRKLASDLHDYLAQLLVLGRMKMTQVKRQSVQSPAMQALTKDVDDILLQMLTYTRTLIAELSPPSLQGGNGLPEALRWLADRMQKDGLWVEVEAEVSQRLLALSEERALFLFQSVRELLFNVLKHARVDRAVVRLIVDEEGDVRVAVEDQGQGLDRDVLTRSAEPGHLGLLSVRERMEAMGGRMELTSIPGDGTTITLILPPAH